MAPPIVRLPSQEHALGKSLYAVAIGHAGEWPEQLEIGPEVAFVVSLDERASSDEEIRGLVRKLIGQGAIRVVFSGTGEERLRSLLGENPELSTSIAVEAHTEAELEDDLRRAVSGAGQAVVAIVVGQPPQPSGDSGFADRFTREAPSRDEIERKFQHVLGLMESLQQELRELELIDPPQ